jgi:CRISPR-associated endonuclease Cas2
MHYLVAYDIAEPRRLRRVARFMEKRALRCQKSVFWFDGDAEAVVALLAEVAPLLKADEDVVQVWQVATQETIVGRCCGTPLNLRPAGVVLGGSDALFVDPK